MNNIVLTYPICKKRFHVLWKLHTRMRFPEKTRAALKQGVSAISGTFENSSCATKKNVILLHPIFE